MGHFGKRDPKLTEVKAVLQRLQGFPEDDKPEAGTDHTGEGASPTVPSRAATLAVTGATVVALAAGVAGAALFVAFSQSDPPVVKSAEPSRPQVKAALEVARGLMAKGHDVRFALGPYGGYQAIEWDAKNRVYIGASEGRKDGQAAGY